jgi:hypothetical protein
LRTFGLRRAAQGPFDRSNGDFNADGAKDLLLWNASTSENTIWYMNSDNGAFYEAGPSLQPSLAPGLQVVPN